MSVDVRFWADYVRYTPDSGRRSGVALKGTIDPHRTLSGAETTAIRKRPSVVARQQGIYQHPNVQVTPVRSFSAVSNGESLNILRIITSYNFFLSRFKVNTHYLLAVNLNLY